MFHKLHIILLGFLLLSGLFNAQTQHNIDSLENVLSHETDIHKKVTILTSLTDQFLSMDPDKALDYAYQALELADENDIQESKLQAYIDLSEIYWMKSDYRNSLKYANEAKELASTLDLDIKYAESLLLIARIFSNIGDYEKSSDLIFEALKYFEGLNNKEGVAKALSKIGYNYYEMENYENALDYYLQSLSLAREINDLHGIAQGLNNVAAVYSGMGEWENFKSNMKEAAEINKKTGKRLREGINYLNLGFFYMNEKEFDSSWFYNNRAHEIFKELDNLQELASLYVNFSMVYSVMGNYDSSLYYAKKAYDIGLENDLKKNTYNAAKHMHQIFYFLDDCEKAYEYSMIEHQMKDSLDIEESITRLSQLELLYEFEKIEQENKAKQQQRESMYIVSGIIAISIISLIVIILIARIRLKRKNEEIEKQKLKTELELRNKELTSNAMSLMKKNEVLSDIAGKLMDLRATAVKDETKFAIKKIVKELQKSKDSEIWKEFDTRFMQVHNDFYNKLIEQFPDLTPTEQRLCAFLRLNMTSKEISELTGQRTGTIEMARSKVRKKLGIAHDQTNLITFLSQI